MRHGDGGFFKACGAYVLMLSLVLSASAAAEEASVDGRGISVGASVGVSLSPYEDHDAAVTPLPLLIYDGERFYAKGASAGVHVFKNDVHALSLGASYSAFEFDPGDTDSRPHSLLDKRKSTVTADVSYAMTMPFGKASVRVSRDVLGRSDGYTADAGFAVPVLREKFTIVPSIGVEWSSDRQSDYYYGVSAAESARSGLRRHEASASFSPYLDVNARYKITERWSVLAGARLNVLTGDVKDSPMVGRSIIVGGFLGGMFSF